MQAARTLRLTLTWVAAALVYSTVGFMLLAGIAMGECLPRGDPQIYLCDAQKHREVLIYAAVFLGNFVGAGLVARRRNARDGVIYLLAASLLPFLVTLAYVLLANALR